MPKHHHTAPRPRRGALLTTSTFRSTLLGGRPRYECESPCAGREGVLRSRGIHRSGQCTQPTSSHVQQGRKPDPDNPFLGAPWKPEGDEPPTVVLETVSPPDLEQNPSRSGRVGARRSTKNLRVQGNESMRPLPNPASSRSNPTSLDIEGNNQALQTAQKSIENLKARILVLCRSEERLKKQLRQKTEALKDLKSESKGSLALLVEEEEKLEEAQRTLNSLASEVNRYHTWWLTEYYSLKAIIQLVPNRNDVEAVASASHARFTTYKETVGA